VKNSNPSTRFFWNDWERDESLKLASLAAQGLWMRILCICARSDRPGYCSLDGRPLSFGDIAKLTGVDPSECATLIEELVQLGVASTDRNGAIFNRRMARDSKLSQIRSKIGKKGGVAKAAKDKGNSDLPWQKSGKPSGKRLAPLYHSSTNPLTPQATDPPERPPAETKPPDPPSARAALMAKAWAAIGVLDATALPVTLTAALPAAIDGLIAEGCDWARDIAPALAKRPASGLPSSPAYWVKIARSNRAERAAVSPAGALPTADPRAPDTDAKALARLASHARGEWFPDAWGPEPGQPGCLIPAHVLKTHRSAA
jgi:hypothetical protein